ncbi:MAG: hypothetical protein ACK4N5_22840, partial [Myxococcales bacterium]
CLERGDRVGLCAYGAEVRLLLPPSGGQRQLGALVRATLALRPETHESDHAAALEAAQRLCRGRTLFALFTDVEDLDSSRAIIDRAGRLAPRHLPLVFAVGDPAMARAARQPPVDVDVAFERAAVSRILHERDRAIGQLRERGARVVDVTPASLAGAAQRQYLEIKAQGLL